MHEAINGLVEKLGSSKYKGRSGTRRRTSFKPTFEALEERQVLDGNSIPGLPDALIPSGPRMILEHFDGDTPPVNQAGDLYGSFYGGAGAGSISITSADAVSGNSLQATLDSGYAQIQFNPYAGATRGFARDYVLDPMSWQFNTYNRMRFWIKLPGTTDPIPDGERAGTGNFQFGTYVKRVENSDPYSDETGGGHFYHHLLLPTNGQWTQVIINMHPNHRRSANGGQEHGNLTHPTGETDYNYFDALTRFYFDDLAPPSSYPATYLLDEIEFYQELYPENDDQVYSIAASYVPESNRLVVTWNRNKNENYVKHEIRYAFSNIHQIGWDAATPAPNGIISPPGWQGYNGMVYDTTELPLAGHSVVYLAIKPENSDLFSQIVVPLQQLGSGSPTDPSADAEALRIDRDFGLYREHNLYRNWGGKDEIWLRTRKGDWVFVTPDGAVHLWDKSNGASGALVGKLDSSYYDSPEKLFKAFDQSPDQAQEHARLLDRDFAFHTGRSLYRNWGGLDEIWILGRDERWFFVTPSGDIYRWDGSANATGDWIGRVAPTYYNDPSSLTQAYDESLSGQDLAATLDHELGLQFGDDTYRNWGGLDELWIRDRYGRWYYIMPDGKLYRWTGVDKTIVGELVATLDASYHADVDLLVHAYD